MQKEKAATIANNALAAYATNSNTVGGSVLGLHEKNARTTTKKANFVAKKHRNIH